MDPILHRPQEALDLAKLLLRPSSLETRVRNGLFISGARQTGKSTFLTQDVIPTLEASGAVVIYVDLWKTAGSMPGEKLTGAVRKKLAELQDGGSQSFADKARSVLSKIGLTSAEVEGSIEPSVHLAKAKIGGKLKLTFEPSKVGATGGVSLSDALLEVSQKTGRDIVFIVDEVQDMIQDNDSDAIMKELKATRDEINGRPGVHGYFLFVGNGSNRSMVHEMTAQRRSPFYGAQSLAYPKLGKTFAVHALRLARSDNPKAILPSEAAAYQGLLTLGERPSLLQEALATLQRTQDAQKHPDLAFNAIVNAMFDQEGKVELEKLRLLGPLHEAIFARICQGPEEGVSLLYSSDALAYYARTTGRDTVTARQVQRALDDLKESGVVLRNGSFGPYRTADPLLREIWIRHHKLA